MAKKFLAVMLGVMMACCLVACGDEEADSSAAPETAASAVTEAQMNELKAIQAEYVPVVISVNELVTMVELDENSLVFIESINNDIKYIEDYIADPSVLEGEDVDGIIALLKQDLGGAQSIQTQLKAALGLE